MRKAFKKVFQDLKDVVESKEGAEHSGVTAPLPDSDPLPSQGSISPDPDVVSQHTQARPPPTPRDILRYRYQHGTNLGGIFVLEQWLFGSMYDEGVSSSSELDAVVASLHPRGLSQTRQKWEQHWCNALSDDDLQWLTHTAHCNHIRLPIGYFTLGPSFCTNTPFSEPIHQLPLTTRPAEVYLNAWDAVKKLIVKCSASGIGILLDLHAVPGGANHETHSGTSSGKADLWQNASNLSLATRCLVFIADEVSRDPSLASGVIGIQICNESIIDPPGMYEWYNEVIQRVSAIDSSLPIYLSDGWDLGRALRFTRAYNHPHSATSPVFVDSHKYWTFDEKDTSRSPWEIIEQVQTQELQGPELDSTLVGDVYAHQAAVGVYIGEYSLALAPQTWSRAGPDPEGRVKETLTRQFGTAQSRKWQQKATGSAFWTAKMDWMPGWEWGFKHASENGFVMPPNPLRYTVAQVRSRLALADARKGQLLHDAFAAHVAYWDATAKDANARARFEHWRYQDGWGQGWTDARAFFAARLDGYVPSILGSKYTTDPLRCHDGDGGLGGVDENLPVGADLLAGSLDLWILRRMRAESLTDHHSCPFGWEWEHGFRAGVKSFGDLVG